MKEFRNFLPRSLANEIHDKLTSNEFPWFWLDDVTVSPEERNEVPDFYRSQPGMHHTPFCDCLLYTSPSPRDRTRSRMPSSA